MIHKSSVIDTDAKISKKVKIGPFCYIGPEVQLDENVELISNVHIEGNTKIGNGTKIFPFSSIGTNPQDLKYNNEKNYTIIGNNNTIREYVTINPGTEGGGSLTALPIIETQAGDVSAYIPTNVISITDGQIFLESNLFLSGVRPAINVGISVSRVGGNAQIKSMKKIAGTLKLDQAQYRELEAFAKFGSDLDAATKSILDKGARNVEILKQGENSPMTVEHQIAIIYCGTKNLLRSVPVNKVKEFEAEYVDTLERKHRDVLDTLKSGKLTDEVTNTLETVAADLTAKYN